MDALRSLFSLRRNITHLVVPPDSRLRAVDGLRALAVLWIIVMHCIWFQMPFIPADELARRLDAAPTWVIAGPYGVDVFFVISGFLIGCILMGEHQRRGTIDVGRFYLRRFLKLMPAYFAALALYAVTIGINNDTIWANVLYVNNFLPGERQAMTWSWSLAIEEQFYFTFPCFLLFVFYVVAPQRRLPLLVGLLGLAFAIRALVLYAYGVTAPVPWSLGVYDRRFLDWAEYVYIKPYTRFGCLVLGVIAAHLHLNYDVPGFFQRYRGLSRALFYASLAAIVGVIVMPVHVSGPLWSAGASLVVLSTYRYVLGAGIAYVMLYSLGMYGMESSALHRFLCWRPWYTVAQLAYSAYLLHPIVFVLFYAAIGVNSVLSTPIPIFMIVLPALSLVAAAVMYLLIERPFMNMRELAALRREPRGASVRAVPDPQYGQLSAASRTRATSVSTSSSVVR